MAKKKIKSISRIDLLAVDAAASGSLILGTDLSLLAPSSDGSVLAPVKSPSGSPALFPSPFGSNSVVASGLASKEASPVIHRFSFPPLSEVQAPSYVSVPAQPQISSSKDKEPEMKNYAALLKSSAQLQQLGTPVDHVSGAPFVLIPDERYIHNLLKFLHIHGTFDTPSMRFIVLNTQRFSSFDSNFLLPYYNV